MIAATGGNKIAKIDNKILPTKSPMTSFCHKEVLIWIKRSLLCLKREKRYFDRIMLQSELKKFVSFDVQQY